MKIKSLTASFGKLDNARLELKDGLNIIQAPNESGKSTWCAFIKAMLYGINTSERDKTGFLSDKTKYRPWNGKNMEGTMEVRHRGYDVTIQRTSLSSSPMKKFSAFYSDILLPVEGMSADTAGEILTGATDKVFERTAFIRQSGAAVSGDPGLEKRIASLVSTGEEQTSYTETDLRLRARLRKLRHNKTGVLPKLEDALEAEEERLSKMDELCDELADIRQETEKYEERARQLADDLDAYKKLEHIELITRTSNAKKRALEAGAHVDKLREALTKNGLVMNTDDVSEIAALYSSYINAESNAGKIAERKKTTEDSLINAEKEKSASVFKGLSDSAAMEKAQNAVRTADEKRALDIKASSAPQKIFAACAVLLLAAAGYFAYVSDFLYAAIAAAVSVVFGLLFISPLVKRNGVKKRLAAMLAEFSASSADELRQSAEKYADMYKLAERLVFELNGINGEYENAVAEADIAKDTLMQSVRKFFPDITDTSEIAPALSALAEPMKALPNAEIEQAKALAEASALISSTPAELIDAPAEEYIPEPSRSLEDTRRAYTRTGEHIAELSGRDAMLRGELKALGDPIETMAHIGAIKEEIEAKESEYSALSLAIDTLSDAHTELQTKFSPLVNEAAGKIMHLLTSGKYEKLVFDKNFNALATEKGEAVSHDILTLSEGTADQVYLSLRLAMVELLLSSDEPCPIILDDALDAFDDERAANALGYLYGLSKDRQVILFTCHSREAVMMADAPDVNIIKL